MPRFPNRGLFCLLCESEFASLEKDVIFLKVLEELKQFQSLNFESLKGDRENEYSIRLNLQYRLIFSIIKEENGTFIIEAILIQEISKHYEK